MDSKLGIELEKGLKDRKAFLVSPTSVDQKDPVKIYVVNNPNTSDPISTVVSRILNIFPLFGTGKTFIPILKKNVSSGKVTKKPYKNFYAFFVGCFCFTIPGRFNREEGISIVVNYNKDYFYFDSSICFSLD